MRSATAAVGTAAVPLAPFVALLGGACAMAISPTFVRLADVGPFTSAFWRVLLALPLLWGWMTLSERRAADASRPRPFARPTVLAGLAFAGDLLCWHLAVVKTSIANATFFATMAPVWVVVVGWLFFRERVGRAVLLGLGLCLVGGAALVSHSLQADLTRVAGDGLGILTGVFFGLYFLAVSAARTQAGAARVTFELSLVAVVVLFAVALVREHAFLPGSGGGWAALFGMAFISHAGGQGLLSVALGRLPAVFSSLVIFLEAIAAALFAWAILGEAVTGVQALGGAFIVLGLWVGRPRRAAEPRSSPRAT